MTIRATDRSKGSVRAKPVTTTPQAPGSADLRSLHHDGDALVSGVLALGRERFIDIKVTSGKTFDPTFAKRLAEGEAVRVEGHGREGIWPGLYSSVSQMWQIDSEAPRAPLWIASEPSPRDLHSPIAQIEDGKGPMQPEARGVDNDNITPG